ncbi:MAG: MarR family transcriptional regulator [Alphaproteobacteria bacterium]|nr:MarR family transcriptional regulator [Alphaproteobacteria bacterium]
MRPSRTARRSAREPEEFRDSAKVKFSGLNDLLGHQLRMAYVASSRRFASAMQQLDLTQKQVGVLWLIDCNNGVSQIALATQLGMDRASMMAIVDRLQERHLIVRKKSLLDGRRQELYATARGRKTLARAKAAISAHERWLTAHFKGPELTSLITALKRISA